MMNWSSITGFISYKAIADYFEIVTDTDYVVDGKITPTGLDYIFKIMSAQPLSDEQRLFKENEMIHKLTRDYKSPDTVAKEVDWILIFQNINSYTKAGSHFDFLKTREAGDALQWFETPDGFSITLYPPIMIFIDDMQYMEDNTLPEFNFEDLVLDDLFYAIDQAMQNGVLKQEASLEAFIN